MVAGAAAPTSGRCFLSVGLFVCTLTVIMIWLPTPRQEKVVIGVAYDCVEKMVYWTEITSPSISKASIEGGDPVSVIRSGRSLTLALCSDIFMKLF